jgi:neutral trehalase
MLGTPLFSPAELFGELLHEVQVRRLFSDGKYFVDMEPLLHPAQIMSHYHRLGPCDDATLAAFVARHFVAPTGASTHSVQTGFGWTNWVVRAFLGDTGSDVKVFDRTCESTLT